MFRFQKDKQAETITRRMAISSKTIESIRNALDIVEVVRSHVPNLKQSGRDYSALCPFHSEKTPSFYVSPSKNMFHCFGCKAGGDIFKFMMLIENLDYPEAIRKLATRAGIKIEETYDAGSSEKRTLLEILKEATDFYYEYICKREDAGHARKYLLKRGITQQTIDKFTLGWAPAGNKFFEIAGKKYKPEMVFKAGLAGISQKGPHPYDFMRERVVFPILNLSGDVVAFGGRTLKEDVQPVYLNTPDTTVYSKARNLYGLFHSKTSLNKKKHAIILEGYMDVLVAHQHGIDNCVAPQGTSLTDEQLKLLKKHVDTIVLIFDSDESGRQAAIRSGEMCLEHGFNCRVVSLPEGMDPDEYILRYGADRFCGLADSGVNPVEFRAKELAGGCDMSKPENKSKFVRQMLETVVKIRDNIFRHEMIKFLSQVSGVAEGIIFSELRHMSGRSKFDSGHSLLDNLSVRLRSVEEEIVGLCLQNPQLAGMVPVESLSDERCARCLPLMFILGDGGTLAGMMDSLDEDTSVWLRQLSFETRVCESPEKTMDALLKCLNQKRQEERRRNLESEVIPMWEGKSPVDMEKIKEFEELTRQLKGMHQNE